ncbi:MAG: cryptochrome/photolyase family protein [Saprospiraceae bacterium]|nr:cryptochrome/photolyase family protein [Saprospiraceae bacterium]
MKKLRLILGDQLNHSHSWFDTSNKDTLYVLMEMRQETDYVTHHIQKVVAFFTAMRAFADTLKAQGHTVTYIKLDDSNNHQSLTKNITDLIESHGINKFEYQLPDEYRLDQQLKAFCDSLTVPSEAFDTEHFLTQRDDLGNFFKGKKTYLMESFYRSMRRKHNILMDGDQPETGKWNYDAQNRKKMPKTHTPPSPILMNRNVNDIFTMLQNVGVKTIGNIDADHFIWPVTRKESLKVLDYFTEHLLHYFGDFQDAMTPEYWSLYHSRVSFALNAKILNPLEVVHAVIDAYRKQSDRIDISQVEGFVRQIIGWREYMRGIYWAKMPEFAEMNYLDHTRKLPSWFWTGKTKMKCMSHSIQQSLDYAYAHHIQRLMVTGNFALLAGIDPDEIDQWYLGIYIDAIEWVEITNTRGMSQFADGGIVGTKPYVSSANYIDKMSHYCKDCYYDKKVKTGPKACPFNSLYWNFYDQHTDKLSKNPRIGMAYRTWAKMDNEKKEALLLQANHYLEQIEDL